MAEVIISKHRKGATGIIVLGFKGQFTRFENPEDKSLGNRPVTDGGEIRNFSLDGENHPPEGLEDGDIKDVIPPPDEKPLTF